MNSPLHGLTLAAQGLRLPPVRSEMGLVKKDDGSLGDIAGGTQGIPAFWFARSLEMGSGEILYRPYADSAWVQGVIKLISRPCGSVDVEFSRPSKTAIGRNRLRKRADQAPAELNSDFLDFLNEPASGLGWADFVEASIGWLKMAECFWLLDDSVNVPFPETRSGPFPKVIIARPDRMRAVIENGRLSGWVYTPPGGQSVALLPTQVIRLMNWNPYDDWRGLGEYQAAKLAAEGDWLAGKFTRNLGANNADLGGFVIAKNGVPTNDQREQIIASLRAKREAQQRGQSRLTFLTGDIDIKEPIITSVDAPFISQRLESRHEVAFAFGAPMSMVDVTASYSIGSASDYFRLINDACIPAGKKFCDGLEKLILLMTGQRVEARLNWDEHYVMQAVREERMKMADGLWAKGMPMDTISEVLNLNLPKYPGSDTGFVPISVSPITNEDGEVDRGPGPDEFDEGQAEPAPDDKEDADKDADKNEDVEKMLVALGCQGSAGASPYRDKSKNEELWRAHMQLRSKAVRQYQSKASKVFNQYRAIALKRMAAANSSKFQVSSFKETQRKSLLDLIFDPDAFGRDLNDGLDPVARTVLDVAASELLSEIGRPDDPWKLPPPAVLQFLRARTQPIKNVGDTARSQLNTALEEGVKSGETMDQLTDRVRGVFNNLSKSEARRIAMTETSAAYGYSRHQAMLGAGVKAKGWVSSHGPNVRPAHQRAEFDYGKPADAIPVTEAFIVDGEALMYPGDPSGSPGNIINCQCVQVAVKKPEKEEDES